MLHESMFYTKLYEDNINVLSPDLQNRKLVQCNLCGKSCKIANNDYGFCNTQKNIDGKLYSLNYQKWPHIT